MRNRVQIPKVVYTEKLSNDLRKKMEADLTAYENTHGVEVNYKKFALVLKNMDQEVIGILTAHTAYSEVYIRELWVDEKYQNRGHGKQLIQELESLYAHNGLNNINLVSCEYQAPEFYKKCGYTLEYVRKINENQKLNLYFFVKFFSDLNPSHISQLNIEYFDELSEELESKMELGLKKHEEKNGITVNYRSYAFVLINDNTKEVKGILNAFHSYSSIYIENMWVDSSCRNQGYGRQLIQELENRFRGKGFYHINLVTFAFQPSEFYKKCGFTLEFTRKNIDHPKLNKSSFVKFF